MRQYPLLPPMPGEKETIRALAWNQPYASLMLHGKIETRPNKTSVRGKVLIYSCKEFFPDYKIFDISGERHMYRMEMFLEGDVTRRLLGHAIAVGELVDCWPMRTVDEEMCFVKYNPNLFCWHFDDVRAIEPFPWTQYDEVLDREVAIGKQGWSILNDEQIEKIKYK